MKRRKAGGDDGSRNCKRESRARRRTIISAGVEENTLAILDAHESQQQQARYSHDDTIAFLEAVRNASVVAQNASPPTDKMLDAIFEILRTGQSMESIMASFHLLSELETQFPRASSSTGQASDSSSSCHTQSEAEVFKEEWSPFALGSDSVSGERVITDDGSSTSLDPYGFHALIQDLAGMVNEPNYETLGLKSLRNLLVFEYLVNVLGGDFSSRKNFPKETMDWLVLRESLLNMLLSSRKINYKGFIKDCLSFICGLRQFVAGFGTDESGLKKSTANLSEDCSNVLMISLLEVGENASMAMQKLVMMMMELDLLRKRADMQGCTTRADGVRTPVADLILDELIYNDETLSPFFQDFNQPKVKLDIILQYFAKYMSKPSVRTRRAGNSDDDTTFYGVLKFLSNPSSLKSIVKKVGGDTVQLLVAHAFKAHLSLSYKHNYGGVTMESTEDQKVSSLIEVCHLVVSAFESLRKTERLEIIPVGKEALFVASAI